MATSPALAGSRARGSTPARAARGRGGGRRGGKRARRAERQGGRPPRQPREADPAPSASEEAGPGPVRQEDAYGEDPGGPATPAHLPAEAPLQEAAALKGRERSSPAVCCERRGLRPPPRSARRVHGREEPVHPEPRARPVLVRGAARAGGRGRGTPPGRPPRRARGP